MEPFKVSKYLSDIKNIYPDAQQILDAAEHGGEKARHAIARQWLSEGIPYAFKDCPGVYESVREWMATRLDVDPKEVNLTGSARLGQSLSPNKVGKPFDNESDLDIFIVSSNLFDKLKTEFNEWSYDYESENISASNKREEKLWKDNLYRCPKNILRGFIDSNLIPNRKKYSYAQNVAQTMYMLKEKLSATKYAPKICHASVRCYKSWDSYVRQISLGLH